MQACRSAIPPERSILPAPGHPSVAPPRGARRRGTSTLADVDLSGLRVVVAGYGSIGRRHALGLRRLGISKPIVVDTDPLRRQLARREVRGEVLPDFETALATAPDAVLICTPARAHVRMAREAVGAGAHVFIEKPIGVSGAGVPELEREASSKRRVVQVGYNLRFHPAFVVMEEILRAGGLGPVLAAHVEFGLYLPKWWPDRDYRESYMGGRGSEASLLRDASHEIDAVRWLLGEWKEGTAIAHHGSGLDVHTPCAVDILAQTIGGCHVQVHLDCLQPVYVRRYKFIGEDSLLIWDCGPDRVDRSRGRLRMWSRERRAWAKLKMEGSASRMYLEELASFFRSVIEGLPPRVTLRDGLRTIQIACRLERAMARKSWVRLE